MEVRLNTYKTIAACLGVIVLFLIFAPVATASDSEEFIQKLEKLATQDVIHEKLLELTLTVGQVVDPHLDIADIGSQIREMAKQVQSAAGENPSAETQILALNKVIFQNQGFSLPSSKAPTITGKDVLDLYLLHRILKTRKAHCGGLCTLYAVVAEAAQIPINLCFAPVHLYCRLDEDSKHYNIECTLGGKIIQDERMQRINGAKPAAVESGIYYLPLTKRQFLCCLINYVTFGLIKQENGPAPLTMEQLLRLAELLEKLNPNHPDSLDTAALIYSHSGKVERAVMIQKRVIDLEEKYGTTLEVLEYSREMLKQYQAKP